MKKNENKFSKLRKQAEASLDLKMENDEDLLNLSNEAKDKLLTELRIHQIELEMQNEELRRTQLELEATRDKYADLYDFAPVGYFTIDKLGKILEVNLTAASLLGVYRTELIGKIFSRFIVKDFQDNYYLFLKKIFKSNSSMTLELKLIKNDGTDFFAQIESSIVQNTDGNINNFRMAILDITKRKETEELLKSKEVQLRHAHKMEAVGTLSGGIAHEFNNLLNIISGSAELLISDARAEDLPYLKMITKSVLRGADLVKRILAFSRKFESNLETTNLNYEILNLKKIIAPLIPKMIDIELVMDDNLYEVNTDKNQIEQVLINLCVNARDAMPNGGKLTIKTENVIIDESIIINNYQIKKGLYVILSVSDTGFGIDKETQEHIFDPFFTTKGIGKGTGLGLSVIYGIVKGHNGVIICESKPNEGASFKIYLPASSKDKKTKHILSKITTKNEGGKEKILIVDDEKDILIFTQKLLEQSGYKIFTAESAESAIKIYIDQNKTIDLIILDLNMPGIGGHKCLEKLLELNPDVKVLISSGFTEDCFVRETINAGAKDFIVKPYPKDTLFKAIRNVLDE
ncbi:multi-sensor hybrid histidine kinase [Candidatus Magnetomorum sp. HK-1]|nr:multi-sensor hybrid histidine kinase [Candidatus Magnetomorum sp. HK-1]